MIRERSNTSDSILAHKGTHTEHFEFMLHSSRNFPLRPSQQCQLPLCPSLPLPFFPFFPSFRLPSFFFFSPRRRRCGLTPFRPFYGLVTSNLRVAHFSRDKPGEAPTRAATMAGTARATNGPSSEQKYPGERRSEWTSTGARAAAVTSTLPRRSAKNIAGRSERGTVPELSFLRMHFAFSLSCSR